MKESIGIEEKRTGEGNVRLLTLIKRYLIFTKISYRYAMSRITNVLTYTHVETNKVDKGISNKVKV